MATRDNFSDSTKRTLAIRAAHFCSDPHCLKLTAGPHSDPNRSLTTGHAAHIHAASPNGPRYDSNQTPAQRKAIANGLWLCRECGDIVDKDDSPHSADLLRQWRTVHEAMIAEVRTKGYADSLTLLQSRRVEPIMAKKIIGALEDRRALWQTFDAELPDRVRQSLDHLRSRLVDLRYELADGSPLDQVLLSLTKTIHTFFNTVETSDLTRLRCNSNDPEWRSFNDALATLRKAVGLQISNLAQAYGVALSSDLQTLAPRPVEP
ncbi:MAG: hypothetical protein CFE43_19730 [Burkholderiales bacterium PBB3]|nr:MAG: hypothetical protein CFE43_19730 [Burkholderiales bacterium PBB3]